LKYYEKDEIQSLISHKILIQEIEQFYKKRTKAHIPKRIHLDDGQNTVLIMPAFDSDYYVIKLVGVAPNNYKMSKSSIYGTVILHCRKTLEPLAFFDGKVVTSIRTGAIGGLSIKYLAKESADSIGIIGTGVQGWSHLQAAMAVRDIKTVYLYNRSSQKLNSFKKRVQTSFPNLEVFTPNVEELIEASDIIITTTTSYSPVLPNLKSEYWEGKHIVAVGSFKPTMQELPDTLLQDANPIYVDTEAALTESGDMIKAKKLQGNNFRCYTLEEIIQKELKPSLYSVFKSVGMSLFDLITVKTIYERNYRNIH
jgi:ornithine cyclodeaminase/alanine dehydrogenase-like protein (mu-crystallin family)